LRKISASQNNSENKSSVDSVSGLAKAEQPQILPNHCIEVKTQNTTGSVDEKLQTCDFKKKQYQKLFFPLNIEVQFTYILDDWFRQPKYKDVLDYIISVGCQYYFQYIPLQKLGLPVPPTA